MRAIVIDQFGEKGSLREIPDPRPGADEILVRVTAAGVNPIDWKVRDGKAGPRAFPLVLGQDFAGVVEAAGANVTRLREGQRVFGVARAHGSYAEKTVVPTIVQEQPVAAIPDGVNDDQAAALPTPALTALASIEWLGVADGTVLLIAGVAGAVGGFASQIAKARGAHVIGTVKGGSGAAEAHALGADEVIDAEAGDPFDQVKEAQPGGIDAVLDLVSDGETLKKNAAILKPGGKLITTVHVADEAWFTARGLKAYNIVMNQTPQSSPEGLETVARLVLDGTLTVRIAQTSPLAEGAAVLDGVKAGRIHGKAILHP
jgi:NADPH:quinone reductase-like Zn-dependent oxidoreductase